MSAVNCGSTSLLIPQDPAAPPSSTHARYHMKQSGDDAGGTRFALRPGARLRACTHRHHHRVLSVEFGDEFVPAAPLRVVERPEATHHLHPAHPATRRILHHRRREEASRAAEDPGRASPREEPEIVSVGMLRTNHTHLRTEPR